MNLVGGGRTGYTSPETLRVQNMDFVSRDRIDQVSGPSTIILSKKKTERKKKKPETGVCRIVLPRALFVPLYSKSPGL